MHMIAVEIPISTPLAIIAALFKNQPPSIAAKAPAGHNNINMISNILSNISISISQYPPNSPASSAENRSSY